MSEVGPRFEPEPMVEPDQINEDLLLSDPVKYGNMLYAALHEVPLSKHFQTSQDEEVRAVCSFCSQFNEFIENAFDELFLNRARPGRAKTLWDEVNKIDYSQTSPITRSLLVEDVDDLIKEQKICQRAIAHLYVLDELAIALANDIIQQNDPARQKSA
jgi:hypothetical protein